MLLGVAGEPSLPETSYTLALGDVVCFLTDGALEPPAPEGEWADDDLYAAIAGVEGGAEAVCDAVVSFVRRQSGDNLGDDLAVLAVEVTGQPTTSAT